MKQKTSKDYEEEIEELKVKEHQLEFEIKEITITDIPFKEKEILEARETIKEKKEEIRKISKKEREELRNLERNYRSLLKERNSLSYQKRKFENELRNLPSKISYREKKMGIMKDFNPSERGAK